MQHARTSILHTKQLFCAIWITPKGVHHRHQNLSIIGLLYSLKLWYIKKNHSHCTNNRSDTNYSIHFHRRFAL